MAHGCHWELRDGQATAPAYPAGYICISRHRSMGVQLCLCNAGGNVSQLSCQHLVLSHVPFQNVTSSITGDCWALVINKCRDGFSRGGWGCHGHPASHPHQKWWDLLCNRAVPTLLWKLPQCHVCHILPRKMAGEVLMLLPAADHQISTTKL